MDKNTYQIKIPVGTIVKVAGHPVQLKESLYIMQTDIDNFLNKHFILEVDNGQPIRRDDEG